MDRLIEQFDGMSVDMESYYIKDFTEFYKEFGYSHQQAVRRATQAAKEQIAIDVEAMKRRNKAEMRKRIIEWMKIVERRRVEKKMIDKLTELIEKLSIK